MKKKCSICFCQIFVCFSLHHSSSFLASSLLQFLTLTWITLLSWTDTLLITQTLSEYGLSLLSSQLIDHWHKTVINATMLLTKNGRFKTAQSFKETLRIALPMKFLYISLTWRAFFISLNTDYLIWINSIFINLNFTIHNEWYK